MKTNFEKMSGAGNDFVVVDNRAGKVRKREYFARQVCDRHWGVGADGLLLVEKSKKADFKMMYYNSDGSYGGMCGNGGRCIAMFAYKHKIAASKHTFEALEHIYNVKILNAQIVRLAMKDPTSMQTRKELLVNGRSIGYYFINTGSPHVVIVANEISELSKLDVQNYGSRIRWNEIFQPQGMNVNFVEQQDANTIYLRTYERGVEAETLACGTGSVAAAIVASSIWKLNSPIKVIPTSKIPLKVGFKKVKERISNAYLEGPAITTFSGMFSV
jgi:diaminopimelate epimerase